MTTYGVLSKVLDYVEVWNAQDDHKRTAGVNELWAVDGAVINARHEYRGREAVLEAVARSFERFTAKGYRYRAGEAVQEHHRGIYLPWEMLDPAGKVVSVGPNFLLLDDDGLIQLDFQFVDR